MVLFRGDLNISVRISELRRGGWEEGGREDGVIGGEGGWGFGAEREVYSVFR